MRVFPRGWRYGAGAVAVALVLVAGLARTLPAQESPGGADGGTITLRSDIQEANSVTGVITARGNVQIDYPARQIVATAAQAQYFSNEQRIILSGNVVILQEGNTLRAEVVTYLIDEGRFVALPDPENQVESTYLVPESADSSSPTAPPTPLATPDPDPTLVLPPLDPEPEPDPEPTPIEVVPRPRPAPDPTEPGADSPDRDNTLPLGS